MTADIIQYASVAGELANNLWGRTDFEKYDAGWAIAKNWLVDYRGGLISRGGFEFGDIIQWAKGERVKFIEFQFSPDTANTYNIILTDSICRFVQDNAYILETAVSIGSVANGTGNRITITANGHGFADGDWVKLSGFTDSTLTFLNGRTVEVANKTTNTFDIDDPADSSLITKASISTDTGSAYRIYTIASPYSSSDLERLQAVQIRDYVRLTHPDYPIKNLIRSGATSWAISDESIGRTIGKVTNLAEAAKSDSNGEACVWQVTAVNENGEEGLPDILITTNGPSLLTQEQAYLVLSWTAVSGAVKYNIYRSKIVSNSTYQFSDATVGYIGSAIGNRFADNGITADYTRQPPQADNPFANGRIRYVTVSAAGTNYDYDSTITWPAGGSNAYGFLVINGDGSQPIRGVIVLDGGEDYTGTTVTAADGSGATMTAVLSAASGNNPHCAALFQQRMIYGATDNYPLSIFGSQPGLLSNFDVSQIAVDDDAYAFELDSEKVAPIRHMLPVRGGLLLWNEIGTWLLYGRQSNVLTANNAASDIQNSVGASYVRPLYVDSYVVYVSDEGQELRMLVYDDYSKVYGSRNVSQLSNHLFKPEKIITSSTYAPVPSQVVYATQDDGTLLSCTIDVDNGVYAVTRNYTRGYFRACLAIKEDKASRLYVAVEREINGNTVLYFERMVQRNFATLDNAFCVDAGLQLTKTAPSGTLTPSSLTGAVTFTVTGATPFVSGDVGKVLRCGSGKATISGYTSSTEIDGTWDTDLEETYPESSTPMNFASGDWWLDSPTDSPTGAWHLIGEAVTILADGVPVTDKTINSEGGLDSTLDTAASRIAIGTDFTCVAQTLPLTVGDATIEGRTKDILGIAVRMHESYGLKMGPDLSILSEIADRPSRLWSEEPRLRSEMIYEPVESDWSPDAQTYFVQDSPRPATILSFIRDTDIGDDKD